MTKFFGAVALGCGFFVSAFGSELQASFTINSTVGGSALANVSYASFDNIAPGTTTPVSSGGIAITFAGNAMAASGSTAGVDSAPILSGANNTFFGSPYTGADTTTYLSAGSGSVTLTFAGPETYFGILWGSVDAYNTLTFYNNGVSVGTVTGSDVTGNTNGSQTVYANIISSLAFTSVVASSSAPSFEFDNVAYAAVPEPSSIALCGIAGLGGLVVARVRRKRSA